jgi:cell division protein FtsB
MRKFLYLITLLCLFISCSEESQQRNEALKNERIKLEQTIDSLKQQQFIVTAFNDSLFLLNKNIMENMESRERNDRLMNERKQLEVEVNGNRNINEQLKHQHKALVEQINKDNFALAVSRTIYIVKIKIHQTTYTLDIGEHIKNKINDIEFEIPVDKAYYDKCSIGQKVSDPGLKLGSLLVNGDFSKLKVKITGKRTVKRN